MRAYDTFADAASTNALKVVLQGTDRRQGSNGHVGASIAAAAAKDPITLNERWLACL